MMKSQYRAYYLSQDNMSQIVILNGKQPLNMSIAPGTIYCFNYFYIKGKKKLL